MQKDKLLDRECQVGIELFLKDKIKRIKSHTKPLPSARKSLTIEKSMVKTCTPQNPMGACMVSESEGACGIAFKYGKSLSE